MTQRYIKPFDGLKGCHSFFQDGDVFSKHVWPLQAI